MRTLSIKCSQVTRHKPYINNNDDLFLIRMFISSYSTLFNAYQTSCADRMY